MRKKHIQTYAYIAIRFYVYIERGGGGGREDEENSILAYQDYVKTMWYPQCTSHYASIMVIWWPNRKLNIATLRNNSGGH